VTLQDTGVGIPREKLHEIFRPFVSLRPEGIGLGLAVVQRILKQHQGSIFVRSTLGRGSRFTLELPLPGEAHG
jgi:signal transduction histidine kinase